MVDGKTLTAMQALYAQQEANIRARVFEKWGVDLSRVYVYPTALEGLVIKTNGATEDLFTDTELIPGMLWAGYSERMNTLVLRTA